MPKNTRTNRRRKRSSAIAQRQLPLYMPARPREEYRLRDLIEQLNLALETYIDRAVVEIDPETAGRWIHVSQWTATRPTPPASQGDVAFELEQRK